MSAHPTAAVIGAGIAGTSAAYQLKKAGFDVTVFEERDRVGGRIWSIQKGDFLMDLGTSAYLGTYKEAIELIHEVGLGSEFTTRPALGGFPREGTNHYIDYTKMLSAGLRTKLLSTPAKIKALRMLADVYKVRKSLGYDRYDQLEAVDTETVREYCRRVLNEELLQWLGRPLVSGTWVADDNDTSVALLLWTVRNMLAPNVYNLNSGVVGLPVKLATYVDTRLEHTVHNVTDNGSQVEVTYSEKDGPEKTGLFDTCVIAATAEPAMKMYPQMDDLTTELYAGTRYRKLGSICIGLSREPKSRATYYLTSPYEAPDMIAVIADHIKAANRAPEGKGLLTVLLSHEYLEQNEHLSDEEVLQHAVDRASQYHGYDLGPDVEESMVVRWPMSVPTMDKGRFTMISNYHKKIDRGARVQFASDLDRISGLNGGLVSGKEAAQRVVARTPGRCTVTGLLAVDRPPLDMTSAVGAQDVMQYAVGAVVVVMLLGAAWHWRRSGRPTGLLLLVGGLFCSLNEALVDLLGHCYFPKDHGIAYTAYGYSVPWWVVTAYVAYFGGLTWLQSEFLRSGPTRARVWQGIAAVWVLNVILEMPPLAAGVYQYYGDQPFEVGGFPLNWLVINALGSLFAAVLVARFAPFFTGARQVLLLVVPYATYFMSWVAHIPLFTTINAEVPSAARWVAALVSALIGLAAMDALIRLATARRGAVSPAAERVTASAAP